MAGFEVATEGSTRLQRSRKVLLLRECKLTHYRKFGSGLLSNSESLIPACVRVDSVPILDA